MSEPDYKAQRDALLSALKGMVPTCRNPAGNCWCSFSWDIQKMGHEPRCNAAREAIKAAEDAG